jgi:hypothetical protein
MINLLIKIADSLDERGLHIEASQVDELIRKLARDLEEDFSKSAAKKKKKKMDPIGKEDKDVDNDGDEDETDEYLLNRRKAIGKAIKEKSKKKTKKEKKAIDEAYQRMISKKSRRS